MPTRLTKEEKEAIEWTQKHRAVAERRTRMLKGTGIFLLFVAIGIAIVLALVVAAVLLVAAFAFAIAAFAFAIVLIVALIYTPDNIYTPDKYGREAVVGIISGVSIGIVLALIYIAPMASIAQYPISICTGTPPGQNVTWQGTILNVSTR